MDNLLISQVIDELHRNTIILRRGAHKGHPHSTNPSFGGKGRLLSILRENSGISQKALSDLMHIRPQSLTELVSKLESGGFIERKQNEFDRRVTNIFITESGLKEAENFKCDGKKKFEKLFEDISESDLTELRDLLIKVNNTLEMKIGPEED